MDTETAKTVIDELWVAENGLVRAAKLMETMSHNATATKLRSISKELERIQSSINYLYVA